MAWNYAAFASSRVVTLVTTAVLARLLVPRHFGLVAIGLVVLTYLDALRDLGIGSAVIYADDADEDDLPTALALSVMAGASMAAVVAATAPLVAGAFDQPPLTDVLRGLSLSLFVTALGAVPEARVRRRLAFRARLVPEVGRAVAKGGVAIALAASGGGVWSLVWGQLAGSLAGTALYWVASDVPVRVGLDRAATVRMLRYGGGIVAVGLLSVVVRDVDYLVVGRALGADDLGYYSLAFRIPELAVMSTCYAFSQTLFPVFSRIRAFSGALVDSFLDGARALALLTLPVGGGIAVVAPDAVLVVFGAEWAPAGPPLRLLALYAVARSIGFVAGDLYKATGRTSLLVKLALVELPIAVVGLAVATRWDITGVAAAQLAIAVAVLVAELAMANRFTGASWRDLLAAFGPGLVGAVGAVLAAGVTRTSLGGAAPESRLAACIAAGVVGFVLAVGVFARPAAASLLRSLRPERAEGEAA